MTATKSAHAAIEEFVEAIAEQYVAAKSRSSDGETISPADEFVSAIEHDLRSTLRNRLSQLETRREVEETPTVELSASEALEEAATVVRPKEKAVDDDVAPGDHLDQTIDTEMDAEALTGARETSGSSPSVTAGKVSRGASQSRMDDTLDFEFPPQASADGTPSRESGADEPTLDTMASDPSQKKPSVRPGKSSGIADLSYGPSSGRHRNRSAAALEADAPDGYEILGTLGKGGMGVVYKARHTPLNRMVAVKMIIAGANASADMLTRFQREAEAAAHLTHPNIVSVYEVGTHKGLPFFSLEFVDGKSVSDLMRETTFSAQDAAELLIPVSRAVHYSHEKGILHRDLKPQNILLTQEGVPKVADFGLAKRLNNLDDEQTREGVILGTPGYMAPEQARTGCELGPATDVYALGSILYYLMTGRPPFVAPTPFETVRQSLLNEPLAPSKLQTTLDKDLETICLKALEKDPAKRYSTAADFADELQRFVNGDPIIARPITRRERVWKWCKRNPKVATLTGLAASLLLCLLFGGLITSVIINEQKKAEKVARLDAEAARGAAVASQVIAEEARRDAETNAELSNDVARLVVYGTKEFMQKPELQPLREKLMVDVVSKIEDRFEKYHGENKSDVFAATADRHLGQIYVEAGQYEKAIEKLSAAQRQLVTLSEAGKVGNVAISQMLITLALGDAYYGMGEPKKAEKYYVSLEKQKQAAPNSPISQSEVPMTKVLGKLARVYRSLGNPDKSRSYVLRSVELHREKYKADANDINVTEEFSAALSQLSESYENAGETERMLAASSEALALKMKVAKRDSGSARRHNLARDQKIIARQYLLIGNEAESKRLLMQAANTMEDLLRSSSDGRMQHLAMDVYYLLGITLDRLDEDPSASFQKAEVLNQKLTEKSDSISNRGELLKILARSGQTDRAIELANKLAQKSDKLMSCGYAACGYGLVASQLAEDDPRRNELTEKAIELTRKLIRHGYHDFKSLRSTDLDFEPLQSNADYQKMIDQEQAKLAGGKSDPAAS